MSHHTQAKACATTRREALCRIGNGFGMMAFAGMVAESLAKADDGLRKLDHPAKAKRVIFLYMNGGLSQVDSFDRKPALERYHGQPLPGGTIATERKTGALMRSPFTFKDRKSTRLNSSHEWISY